jgi:hypothetical protein
MVREGVSLLLDITVTSVVTIDIYNRAPKYVASCRRKITCPAAKSPLEFQQQIIEK